MFGYLIMPFQCLGLFYQADASAMLNRIDGGIAGIL